MERFIKIAYLQAALILLCITGVSCQTQTPITFAQAGFKKLQNGGVSELKDDYINQEEFKEIISKSNNPTPSQNFIDEFYAKWNDRKEQFFKALKEDIDNQSRLKLTNSTIDSITYNYVISQPGTDKRVEWPASKEFEIDTKKPTYAETAVYFSDQSNRYLLRFHLISTGKQWKLMFAGKEPQIIILN